ncbi:hypothetical protein SUGI_0121210 [Cryptomeria japonica]|uniref:uncharacterized protein LOC131071375 n=1 Tax=Cryptomeria japonica TaxID=3369 RepID=UPI002408C940|nr:uncharacterized protein LOC131071375 [Cryptomeria japonica]GLJ10067.1 hypothetical protein SUGI_0121210 [Cryptomeria japonica]
MRLESNPLHNGKRARDAQDDEYLDNYHAHKRYLTEVMASSLNGLTVGDSLSESPRMSPSRLDPMESPARTEVVNFLREELVAQDSPMSEDSDDCVNYRMVRYNESPQHISLTPSDQVIGCPTSPVSPQRNQKIVNNVGSQFGCSSFTSSVGTGTSSLACVASFPLQCAQTRQRNSDSESRFPPSPSDPCQSADLRRAALLRSLQMRSQPPAMPSFELSVDNISEQGIHHIEESEYPFGSSAHGNLSAQTIRGSGRVRSLLLDECTLNPPVSMSGLSTPSQQDGNITQISCTKKANRFSNMNSKTKTGDVESKAKEA